MNRAWTGRVGLAWTVPKCFWESTDQKVRSPVASREVSRELTNRCRDRGAVLRPERAARHHRRVRVPVTRMTPPDTSVILSVRASLTASAANLTTTSLVRRPSTADHRGSRLNTQLRATMISRMPAVEAWFVGGPADGTLLTVETRVDGRCPRW